MPTVKSHGGVRRVLTLAAAVCASLTTANAQGTYRGKGLTLIVGNTAGSGYDTYARVVARYMSKHLPGQPGVIIQNMPGAGSVRAADYLYSVAPKDGSTIGTIMPGALVDPLVNGLSKYRYRPSKFEYIGSADSGTRVLFSSAKSQIKSIEDAQLRPSIVASTARADFALMLNALVKTKFKIVTGYAGPAETLMAVERGEGDVSCCLDIGAINILRPGLLSSGKVNILTQIGLVPNAFLTARGIPEIWKYLTPEDRPVVELMVTEQVFQRPFLAPPGTPAARILELRTAFDAAMKDRELLIEASKANLEINPKTGQQVAAQVEKMYAAPKEVVARMSKVAR